MSLKYHVLLLNLIIIFLFISSFLSSVDNIGNKYQHEIQNCLLDTISNFLFILPCTEHISSESKIDSWHFNTE